MRGPDPRPTDRLDSDFLVIGGQLGDRRPTYSVDSALTLHQPLEPHAAVRTHSSGASLDFDRSNFANDSVSIRLQRPIILTIPDDDASPRHDLLTYIANRAPLDVRRDAIRPVLSS